MTESEFHANETYGSFVCLDGQKDAMKYVTRHYEITVPPKYHSRVSIVCRFGKIGWLYSPEEEKK